MSQLLGGRSNKFNGLFDDSDDEHEVEPDVNEAEINYNIQKRYNVSVKNFQEFINNPEFITNKNDTRTNIVDMYSMFNDKIYTKMYYIPDSKINKLFKYIEICRRSDARMMLYERQLEYSGIMLDFDIYQSVSTSYINDGIMQSITQIVMDILKTYINLENPDKSYDNSNEFTTYFAFIKKPEVKYNKEKECYKDGFHLLIPSIKVTREVKRFIIKKCSENTAMMDIFKPFKLADGYTVTDIIDKNSAHVPVFLLGSSSKTNAPAYTLRGIRSIVSYIPYASSTTHYVVNNVDDVFRINDMSSNIVLANELSLNWESSGKDGPIIKKYKYQIKDEYARELQSTRKESKEETAEQEFGNLSLLNIHDPDAEYIYSLLDTLSPFRYTDFDAWFKVLCVLAHTNKSYKPLAEKFSMKCVEKYNPIDFEHYWLQASDKKTNKLSMGSLHYWAREDNPIKYEEIRQYNIYEITYKRIYDPQLEGSLQHFDVAEILFKSLRHKYVYDREWYEFILEEDPKEHGEIYKWRVYNAETPNSLKLYMSKVVPTLFDKVLSRIESTINDGASDDITKYHVMVKKNIKITCKKVRDNGFKSGVMRECEQVFERRGFVNSLDKDPEIIGVANGILKLGPRVELITGFHNYMVSKFITTEYVEFNPYDETTKKVLYTLRTIFPDDEPDTFEFIMSFFAAALDGKQKDSLLVLLMGGGSNGKSFLLELMKSVIGSYGVKMPLSFLLSRNKNAEEATPTLMQLQYGRLCYYSETNRGEVLNMAKVKEITGGESLAGRALHKGTINFKPTCNHIVLGNHDFDMSGNVDHGTWRRIKRVNMRIKFCKESDGLLDPNNPYERLADDTIGKTWPSNPKVLSALLSILCYYYERLQTKYKGTVENVLHPNIELDTAKYRNRQDKMNNFIDSRFVKTTDSEYTLYMSTIIEKYTKWHDALYPDTKDYKKGLNAEFENSQLSKLFTKTKTNMYIKGYRILEANEEPDEGEEYIMNNYRKKKSNGQEIKPETVDEFYKRICMEYDQIKKEREEELKRSIDELKRIKLEELKKQRFNNENVQNNIQNNKTKPNKFTPSKLDVSEYDKSGFKIKKDTIMEDINDLMHSDTDNSEDESGNESDNDSDNSAADSDDE